MPSAVSGPLPAGPAPVKPVTRKKPKPKFETICHDIAYLRGFPSLDVLLIGDTHGFNELRGSNFYIFRSGERDMQRWKPLDRINEYSSFLEKAFDMVASREYFAGAEDYARPGGIYLTNLPGTTVKANMYRLKGTDIVMFSENAESDYGKEAGEYAEGEFLDLIWNIIQEQIKAGIARTSAQSTFIPNIDVATDLVIDPNIAMTAKGMKTARTTDGLLDLYNRAFKIHNPLLSTYSGAIDTFHRYPATALATWDERRDSLTSLGFKIKAKKSEKEAADQIRKKFDYMNTPLMPLLPQQLLAYVKDGDHIALATVSKLGVKKGVTYRVKAGWQHKREGGVKRGYFTLTVNDKVIFEDNDKDVELFVQAFGLPEVQAMAERYPQIFNAWLGKVKKQFPGLEEFQAEDMALAATKNLAYIGHDRGLGKSKMTIAWAVVRGYKRVLLTAEANYLDKWKDELDSVGVKWEELLTWKSVYELRDKIKRGIKNKETVFYLTSFDFISREEIVNDPWMCVEKNGEYVTAVYRDITSRNCPSCGKTVGQARDICPICGSSDYSGRYCRKCKTPTYTYKRNKPLTPEKCAEVEADYKAGRRKFHSGTYPAYKKIRKIFSCILIDEAQDVKTKNSLRGIAARSLHAKARALITASLMKNYPVEMFWTVGWLLGYETPMFPYRYSGGLPQFERQFCTDLIKGYTKEGKEICKRTPEVSNLSIMWRLMAPFMVRRLKTDIEGIAKKEIHPPVILDMDARHADVYDAVVQGKLSQLAEELRSENPDIHIIGANLWSLRAASTVPVAGRYFPFVRKPFSGRWNKLKWIVEKAKEMKTAGRKMIIYSTLTDMTSCIHKTLNSEGIKTLYVKQGTKNRFDLLKKFNTDDHVAIVSSTSIMGKCYDVEGASCVVFADMGWTSDEFFQGCDRANRLISKHSLDVYTLLNRDTVDEAMWDLVMAKTEAITNVLDRRAIYKPADTIMEAVQIRVARAVVEKARTFVRGIVPAEPETIVDAATLFASKPEVEIQADSRIFAAEQITLFAA